LTVSQSFSASINGTLLDLDDYLNGLWGFFGLNQSEAIGCYNGITAENYFQQVQAEYNLAQAYAQGDAQGVQEYAGLYFALNLSLWNDTICVQNTNDWNDLMLAAGVNTFNKSLLGQMEHLYFQAHVNDWANAYTVPYNDLVNAQYNQAGFAYGPIYQNFWNNASDNFLWFLQAKALQNGVFFYWNLTSPNQIPNCYNETSAQWDVEFVAAWAGVVASSTLANAVNNTINFFANNATQWTTPLSESAWKCANTTNDNAVLTKAIGYNLFTEQFQTAMMYYIGNETVDYYLLFSEINTGVNTLNPQYAGMVLGQFYDAVGNWI